jgi:hypothetical protein
MRDLSMANPYFCAWISAAARSAELFPTASEIREPQEKSDPR